MELLGELPYGLSGLNIKIIVSFSILVIVNLVGFYELINLLGIHVAVFEFSANRNKLL